MKFRQDEINQAKNDMNDEPAEAETVVQDIEETKPEVITIPTEASEPVEAPVVSENSPKPSTLRPTTAKVRGSFYSHNRFLYRKKTPHKKMSQADDPVESVV